MNKELERIEQLKHFETILGNCISYLWEIWDNEDIDTIERNFKNLGFTEEDFGYWEIREELNYIETLASGEEYEGEYEHYCMNCKKDIESGVSVNRFIYFCSEECLHKHFTEEELEGKTIEEWHLE